MNAVQKQAEADPAIKQRQAMMQIVRNTIFKNSTDEELALFFHICKSNNVSPLDRLLHPSVYKDSDGNRTVVVVTSIDLMRSRSSETGLDDGLDEPEYGPETIEIGEDTVPEWCKVRLYKKDIDRPFVGIARWKEFYPGEKRGHMWRKMPHVMLAKCAEAQARRQAFPKELGKLYEEAEMMQATEVLAGIPENPKSITPPPQHMNPPQPTSIQGESPDDETRKKNKWISSKQEGLLYGKCKEHGVDPVAVKNWLAVVHKAPEYHFYNVTWAKNPGKQLSEFDTLLKYISEKPEMFRQYAPVQQTQPAQQDPLTPTAQEAFEMTFASMLQAAGKSDQEAVAELLKVFGYKSLSEVPTDKHSEVIRYFEEVL